MLNRHPQRSSTSSFNVRQVLDNAVSPLLESLETRSHFSVGVAPVANPAGPYSVAEGQSVLISGLTSTDADGTVASYQWDTNYSVSKGFKNRIAGPTWTFTADNSGTRTIALRVVDNDGNASSVSTATINISDVAPTLTLTAPSTVDEATPVNVSWTYTDPGTNDVVSAWDLDWGDGTTDTYATGTNAAAHTYEEDGQYTVTLSSTQADATTSISHALTVNNVPPIVLLTTPADTINEGQRVRLNFGSPNRGGSLDSWTIDWGDGRSDAYSAATTQALHLYTDSGHYTATVNAQEPDGGHGSATQAFTVTNVAPSVAITGTPGTGTEGSQISVGSTVTDDGIDDTETYGWTVYRNGSHYTLPGGTNLSGTTFAFTPSDNGSYVVRLSVVDDEGAITTVNSSAIIVANANPSATVAGEPGTSIDEGTPVTLTVTPADVGTDDTFTYAWSVTKGASAFTLPHGTVTTADAFTFIPTDNGSYVANVVVTDNDNGSVTVHSTAITVDNVAPTASISGVPATANEGSTIVVAADPHDAGTADSFTYVWSVEKDSAPYSLGSTPLNGPTLSFAPTDNGSYVISLTVTDDEGADVTTTSSAIVVANVAPTATLTGDSEGTEGDALNFSVAAHDAGIDDTHTYLWTVTKAGNSYNLNGAADTASTFSFTPDDDAAYVVSVVVTDNDGDSVTKTMNVTVANAQPVAAITGAPGTSDEGTVISLGSTHSDAGVNDTLTYAWTVKKGNVDVDVSGLTTNTDSFAFTPVDNGSYVVTLVVTDNGGLARTVSTSAIVVANVDPTGSIAGEPGTNIGEGDTVALTATGADVGTADTLTYAWSIKKDTHAWTPVAGTVTNDANLSFVPTDNGSYVATVVITDKDGGTVAVDSTTIVVDNVAPTASVTASTSADEGDTVAATSIVTDAGVVDTHTYAWSVEKSVSGVFTTVTLPGGTATTASDFSFVPTDNGTYRIKLTVTDKDGAAASTTSSNIVVANVAPTGVITGDSTGNEGATLNYSVAVTDPGSADTQSYLWTVTKGGVAYNLNGAADTGSTFSFTPDDNADYVVSVAITDNDSGTSTATFNVAVANVTPVAAITGAPTTGNEGTQISLDSTVSDAGTLDTFSYAWSVMKGSTAVDLTGVTTNTHDFAFTPADNGSYVVTLVVTDNDLGVRSVSTSAIVIANVAPTGSVAGEPGTSVEEGATIDLTSTGADVGTLDTLSYAWTIKKNTQAWTPLAGTVLNAQNLSFVPTDNGSYVATVVITDKDGGHVSVDSTTIVIDNAAPTASITGMPGTSAEGTALSLNSTVQDDGVADTHTYLWSVTKGGVAVDLTGVTANAAAFTYTPKDNGVYVVSLVVTDDDGGTVTSTSGITVTNVAPAPTLSGNSTVDEDNAITLTAAANDVGVLDTATYLWSVTKGGVAYTANLGATNAAAFTFTPNVHGSYLVSCVVTDNDGGTTTATKTVTVANVAPTAAITGVPSGPRGEGSPITLHGVATDASGETLTYAWGVKRNGVDFPLTGVTTNTTTLDFTPTDNGLYRATFAVTDSGGLTTTSTTSNMTVTNALPDAAITGTPGTAVNEGSPITLHVDAADPGIEDTLTYAWSVTKNGQAFALPSGAIVDATNFTFTPSDQGTYVAKVVVTDDDGGPVTVSTAAITVNNVAPVAGITGAPGSSNEGTAIALTGTATDPGTADVLTYSWSVTKNGSAFLAATTPSASGQAFSFTPADNGSYVVTLVVNDGTVSDTISTAAITVNNVAPAGTISGVTTSDEGSPVTMTVAATDVGTLDTLTYAWTVTKDGNAVTLPIGTIDNAAEFTYTPADQGAFVFTCVVTDNNNAATTLTHNLTVANVAPTVSLSGDSAEAVEGSAITVNATATDPGDDVLTYNWTVTKNGNAYTLPNGTVVNGSSLTFTPDDNGSYVASLTVTDGDTGSTTVNTAAIAVANAAPVVAVTGDTTGTEGTDVNVGTTVTDAGPLDTTFTYAWSVKKDGHSIQLPIGTLSNGASFVFTPSDNGTYVASVVVTDKDGTATTQTASIVVANVAPDVAPTGDTTGEEGTAVSVTAGATDAGTADVLTYAWTVTKDGHAYTLPEGTDAAVENFSFAPTDNGTYVATVAVNDGTDTTTVSAAAIVISNVAPTGSISGPTTGDEGSAVTLTATAADAGALDTLSYAWSVTKDGNAVTLPLGMIDNAAEFAYTPADQGSYVFTCIVTDKDNDDVTLTHTVTVANVAPTADFTVTPETSTEGTALTVTAIASDAGDDTLTYGWTVYRNGTQYALANGVATNGTSLTFTPNDNGSYVARLTVSDEDTGSTTINSTAIVVANVAPVVAITGDNAGGDEGEALDFGSTVTDASSADTTAGFTYAWTAKRGNTTVASSDEANFSFTPSVHGSYTVKLIATDKDGTATTTTSTVNVANVAPTNVAIEGELQDISEGDHVALDASADDVSGDTVHLTWQVRSGDDVFASGEGDQITFTAERGEYEIYVTATDTAGAETTTHEALSVANIAPTGTLTAPTGTMLVGSAATFGLNFGDVPVLQGLNVTWDFGDGSTASNDFTGSQSVIKKHAYAAHGTYTVTATIDDGEDTKVVTGQVTVSEAATIVDPTDSSKTALLVVGSDAADTIAVAQQSNGKYRVTFNGTNLGNAFAPTGKIYVYGNGGSNTISVSGNANAVVFAGSAASNVTTGAGNDIIVGSIGADRLNGGDGRDILIGAAGADILHGNDGEDLLIAGGVAKTDTALLATLGTKWFDGTLSTSARRNTVLSLFGKKQLIADAGGNQIYGELKNDWMVVNSQADRLKDLTKTDLVN